MLRLLWGAVCAESVVSVVGISGAGVVGIIRVVAAECVVRVVCAVGVMMLRITCSVAFYGHCYAV